MLGRIKYHNDRKTIRNKQKDCKIEYNSLCVRIVIVWRNAEISAEL